MIEEMIKDGYLIRTSPDARKAEKSLELAKNKIAKAKAELNADITDNAIVSAYTSMFHSARALLFLDGFKERNHYAVCQFLREKYQKRIEMKYITELNVLRTIRHKVIYGDEDTNIKEVQESEAESAIKMAEGFLKSVGRIVRRRAEP